MDNFGSVALSFLFDSTIVSFQDQQLDWGPSRKGERESSSGPHKTGSALDRLRVVSCPSSARPPSPRPPPPTNYGHALYFHFQSRIALCRTVRQYGLRTVMQDTVAVLPDACSPGFCFCRLYHPLASDMPRRPTAPFRTRSEHLHGYAEAESQRPVELRWDPLLFPFLCPLDYVHLEASFVLVAVQLNLNLLSGRRLPGGTAYFFVADWLPESIS